MSRYAANTEVSVEKSRAEIEKILVRYGATRFGSAFGPEGASIGFEARGRRIRFDLPLPDRRAKEFTHTRHRPPQLRSIEAAHDAWEQACRQRWRALALAVKAKLEAVEAGIASFEEEFLAYIVLPGGQTLGKWATPKIAGAYETGEMPPLLEAPR